MANYNITWSGGTGTNVETVDYDPEVIDALWEVQKAYDEAYEAERKVRGEAEVAINDEEREAKETFAARRREVDRVFDENVNRLINAKKEAHDRVLGRTED